MKYLIAPNINYRTERDKWTYNYVSINDMVRHIQSYQCIGLTYAPKVHDYYYTFQCEHCGVVKPIFLVGNYIIPSNILRRFNE